MLAALQRDLKDLIGHGRSEEVVRRLKEEVLEGNTQLYDDLILVQSRITELERDNTRGVITFENKSITFNSVNEALIWIIGEITLDDLKESIRRKAGSFQHVPPYHAYAVDRVPQTEKFELDRFLPEDPDQKIHFYYLFGDLRQEMQSLVHRLSLERSGRTLSADGLASKNSDREPLIVACKPEPRGNQQLFHILLLKSLLEKFIGPINNMRDLRQKTVKDLLDSPKLRPMDAEDAVCILVTLDDHNWRKDVVPAVLQELYRTFCNCELPASSPHFYFFFGMEYKKENQQVRTEVSDAIANREYGEALDELLPVSLDDITEWFTRHRPLIPPGKEAHEIATTYFPQANATFDMLDVETALKTLIDQHNKGLVLGSKTDS